MSPRTDLVASGRSLWTTKMVVRNLFWDTKSYPFLRDWKSALPACAEWHFGPAETSFWDLVFGPKSYPFLRDWKNAILDAKNAIFGTQKVTFWRSKTVKKLQFFRVFDEKIDFLHKIPINACFRSFWGPKSAKKRVFWPTFCGFWRSKSALLDAKSDEKIDFFRWFLHFFAKNRLLAKKPKGGAFLVIWDPQNSSKPGQKCQNREKSSKVSKKSIFFNFLAIFSIF